MVVARREGRRVMRRWRWRGERFHDCVRVGGFCGRCHSHSHRMHASSGEIIETCSACIVCIQKCSTCTPAHFRGTNTRRSNRFRLSRQIATSFDDKTAGAMLRARWELFVYPGERGPTGNKFGPLPSSHDAAVQNNQPKELQGSDVARRGDVAPSSSLQVRVDIKGV